MYRNNGWRSEAGATAVEYGIMVALIAVAIIAAVYSMGVTLGEDYDCVGAYVEGMPEVDPSTVTC